MCFKKTGLAQYSNETWTPTKERFVCMRATKRDTSHFFSLFWLLRLFPDNPNTKQNAATHFFGAPTPRRSWRHRGPGRAESCRRTGASRAAALRLPASRAGLGGGWEKVGEGVLWAVSWGRGVSLGGKGRALEGIRDFSRCGFRR